MGAAFTGSPISISVARKGRGKTGQEASRCRGALLRGADSYRHVRPTRRRLPACEPGSGRAPAPALLAFAADAGPFVALGGQDVGVAGVGVAPAQVGLEL